MRKVAIGARLCVVGVKKELAFGVVGVVGCGRYGWQEEN